MHLADAFIQATYTAFRLYSCQYICSLRIEPTTFCAANALLYLWATGTLYYINLNYIILIQIYTLN